VKAGVTVRFAACLSLDLVAQRHRLVQINEIRVTRVDAVATL